MRRSLTLACLLIAATAAAEPVMECHGVNRRTVKRMFGFSPPRTAGSTFCTTLIPYPTSEGYPVLERQLVISTRRGEWCHVDALYNATTQTLLSQTGNCR